jgi:hypothetical protein
MSKQPCNSSQIKSEIIRRKLSYSDRVLELLLEGKELSQRNINYYIPEMKPHHLSSVICDLRNDRLVPIRSMWTDDRIMIYWISDDAISDYFDSDARNEQIKEEGFNVRHRRLERDAIASRRFANAVNASEDVAYAHSFVRGVVPDLADLFGKANKKISPSSSKAQAQEICTVDINASNMEVIDV